jgi:hypothetical protein
MSDDFTPASFWKGFGTWVGVGLFLSVIAGGLIVGGWRAGWWFSNQNATRQYQQTQNGTSNQDTLRANIGTGFNKLLQEEVQVGFYKSNPSLAKTIQVEAASQANTICGWAEQVTGVPLPADQATWVTRNCTNGVLSPSSSYYIPSAP